MGKRNCHFTDHNSETYIMADTKQQLDEVVSVLKQQRDEIKLKLHLAEMEAKEEYGRLSDRIDELSNQYDPVKDAAAESADKVFAALKLAADEMKNGLLRIKKSLDD